MSNITASEARANLYRLIDEAAASHQPILITGKRNNAVLVSEEDWSAVQETSVSIVRAGDAGVHQGMHEHPSGCLRQGPRLVSWRLVFTKQAQKDARKLAAARLKAKAQELLAVLAENPHQNPPSYERLLGDLAGACSRRVNIQHHLVYQVLEREKVVKILRLWTHYE